MRTTTLVLATSLLSLAFVSVPLGDLSPAGTAEAVSCTPYLMDGNVRGYLACEEGRCEWDGKSLTMMCYD